MEQQHDHYQATGATLRDLIPTHDVRRQADITDEQIEAALAGIKTLKPMRKATPRDAVMRMAPAITAALARGVTLEQISEQLAATGLAMSAASIRRALREGANSSKPRSHAAA